MSVITCNWLKHHLAECKNEIARYSSASNYSVELINQINRIGNNVIDLYTGSLSANEIETQIILKLKNINCTDKTNFTKWLGKPGYKKILLSDESSWILRLAIDNYNYIHIHPARIGKYTVRVKGSAWKTALILIIQNLEPDIGNINTIRKNILSLSPVKNILANSEIIQALKILH